MWQIAIVLTGIFGDGAGCARQRPAPGCPVADDAPSKGLRMMAKCESGDPRLETAIRKTVTDVAGDENCVLRKYARQHDVDGDGRKDIFVMFIVDPKYRAGSFLKYYVAFSGTRRKPQAEVLPLVEGDGVGVDCVYYDGKEFRVRVFARSVSSEGAPFPSDIERFGLRKGHLVRLSSVTP